jgi:hypothetical protein
MRLIRRRDHASRKYSTSTRPRDGNVKCCRAPLIRVTSRQQPAARQESSGGNEWLRPRPRVALVRPPRPSITRSCCRFAAKEGIIGLAAVASRMGMAARPNRNLATDESIEPNDSASSYHTPVSAALDQFVTGNTKWPRSTRSSLGLYCIA